MRIRSVIVASMFVMMATMAGSPRSGSAQPPGGGGGGGSFCWGCTTAAPLNGTQCQSGYLVGRADCRTVGYPAGLACQLSPNRCAGGKDYGPAPAIG